jgi:hypothetical protein
MNDNALRDWRKKLHGFGQGNIALDSTDVPKRGKVMNATLSDAASGKCVWLPPEG